MTPELKPFLGGTYFPPVDQDGQSGLVSVLRQIDDLWRTRRADLEQQGEQALAALRAQSAPAPAPDGTEPPSAGHLCRELIAACAARFDAQRGGFGDGPKFPRPAALDALLAAHRRDPASDDGRRALAMVLGTLRAMARGGIHDHLGGGFHRYSVDGAWRVPHFEKMLYDQGQLAVTLSEAYRLTGDPELAAVLRRLCDYVIRDLSDPAGGFHAAEDADSLLDADGDAHAEGAWYVWSDAEIGAALTADEAAVVRRRFAITPAGNVRAELDPRGALRGRNVLDIAEDAADIARALGTEAGTVETLLDAATTKLTAARSARPRPHRDDKIITAWNGLMIHGLARAAQALDEPRYAAAASRAASFLRDQLFDEATGTLFRTWRRGQRDGTQAMATDHAYLAQGLVALAETTGESRWFAWANALLTRLDRDFSDPDGGWFDTDGRDPSVLLRQREDYDGAEPSASAVALDAGIRLAEVFDDHARRKGLLVIGTALSRRAASAPTGMPAALAAVMLLERPLRRIVITGTAASASALLRIAQRSPPERVIILLDGPARALLAVDQPFLAAMPLPEAPATAFVCTGTSCQLPTTDPAALGDRLSTAR
ncbi:MAG: thioredoxin domain-containing protein [Planctomycetes bacterium]|nr:thioredoxin domain-containing protein [Planctomycetota bacterium]